ncbi:MAG: DUF4369 domain-containing protein, partial [Muribaculaceae bacterium]|nr:DUF4369 domain-containing protein [Muribaculaceae bacterium]
PRPFLQTYILLKWPVVDNFVPLRNMVKIRLILKLALAVILLFTGACGNSDTFTVSGSIAGNPSMNIRVIYYTDGKVFTGVTAVREGDFVFEGTAPEDALVELYDNEYRLIGRLVARNGDKIKVEYNPADHASLQIKGNPAAERWAEFSRNNADADAATRNAAVVDYVNANTADPLSAMLIMTEYDCRAGSASIADSLLTLLAPEARATDITAGYNALLDHLNSTTSRSTISTIPYLAPGGRTKIFNPRRADISLIAVSRRGDDRDSIVSVLSKLHGHKTKRHLELLDLSIDPDTISWSLGVRRDSVKWTAGWVAGSISGLALDRLGLPSVPYFIVTDSTGRQLWRGTEIDEARNYILTRL